MIAAAVPEELVRHADEMSDEEMMCAFVYALRDTRTKNEEDRLRAEDWMHALRLEAQQRGLKLLDPSAPPLEVLL